MFPFHPGSIRGTKVADTIESDLGARNRYFGRMRKAAVTAVLSCLLATAPVWTAHAENATPKRIVSANLCADELLLALADRGQIASVSRLSGDPALSAVAGQVADIPKNRGSAEDMARLDGDLILTGAFLAPLTRRILSERGSDHLALPPWRNLAEGLAQIRSVAAKVGHPERGEALIARIEQARDALKGLSPHRRSFLVLHRRGYVPGRATLVVEMAELAGMRDISGDLGLAQGGFARLEHVLTARPDFLIVSGEARAPDDQGSALLVHPALAALYPPERRIVVPDQLSLCAGPSTPVLLERLAVEMRAKLRGERPVQAQGQP